MTKQINPQFPLIRASVTRHLMRVRAYYMAQLQAIPMDKPMVKLTIRERNALYMVAKCNNVVARVKGAGSLTVVADAVDELAKLIR